MEAAIELAKAIAEYITAHHDEIGVWVAQVTHGVTSIKTVENRTGQTLRIWKVDKKFGQPDTQQITVPPNQAVAGDFWIPWADNANQFNEHRMTLALDGEEFAWIWQSGPTLHFGINGAFLPGGPNVPGVPDAGGNRRLVVFLMNGVPSFVLTGTEKAA